MIEKKGVAKGELGGAMAVGHKTEVADAVKAVGQCVKKEAANELVGLELHGLCRAALAVILPREGDMIVVEGDEAAVGDRDPMGIAAEISQDLGGPAERLLGVDDPIDAPRRSDAGGEGRGLGQGGEIAKEVQGSGAEGSCQALKESASEQLGEWFDGQEKVRSAGDPARAIRQETATWYDTVQVGMMRQRLPPGVQHGDAANLGAEPTRIGGERDHCLGAALNRIA